MTLEKVITESNSMSFSSTTTLGVGIETTLSADGG